MNSRRIPPKKEVEYLKVFDVKVDTINKIINLDEDFAIADGYNNRNYVGIWESYSRGTIKKCIWGDY